MDITIHITIDSSTDQTQSQAKYITISVSDTSEVTSSLTVDVQFLFFFFFNPAYTTKTLLLAKTCFCRGCYDKCPHCNAAEIVTITPNISPYIR